VNQFSMIFTLRLFFCVIAALFNAFCPNGRIRMFPVSISIFFLVSPYDILMPLISMTEFISDMISPMLFLQLSRIR